MEKKRLFFDEVYKNFGKIVLNNSYFNENTNKIILIHSIFISYGFEPIENEKNDLDCNDSNKNSLGSILPKNFNKEENKGLFNFSYKFKNNNDYFITQLAIMVSNNWEKISINLVNINNGKFKDLDINYLNNNLNEYINELSKKLILNIFINLNLKNNDIIIEGNEIYFKVYVEEKIVEKIVYKDKFIENKPYFGNNQNPQNRNFIPKGLIREEPIYPTLDPLNPNIFNNDNNFGGGFGNGFGGGFGRPNPDWD